jgi:hypothetical protein
MMRTKTSITEDEDFDDEYYDEDGDEYFDEVGEYEYYEDGGFENESTVDNNLVEEDHNNVYVLTVSDLLSFLSFKIIKTIAAELFTNNINKRLEFLNQNGPNLTTVF